MLVLILTERKCGKSLGWDNDHILGRRHTQQREGEVDKIILRYFFLYTSWFPVAFTNLTVEHLANTLDGNGNWMRRDVGYILFGLHFTSTTKIWGKVG